jgi:hypothetical protein
MALVTTMQTLTSVVFMARLLATTTMTLLMLMLTLMLVLLMSPMMLPTTTAYRLCVDPPAVAKFRGVAH